MKYSFVLWRKKKKRQTLFRICRANLKKNPCRSSHVKLALVNGFLAVHKHRQKSKLQTNLGEESEVYRRGAYLLPWVSFISRVSCVGQIKAHFQLVNDYTKNDSHLTESIRCWSITQIQFSRHEFQPKKHTRVVRNNAKKLQYEDRLLFILYLRIMLKLKKLTSLANFEKLA